MVVMMAGLLVASMVSMSVAMKDVLMVETKVVL